MIQRRYPRTIFAVSLMRDCLIAKKWLWRHYSSTDSDR